MVKECHSLSLFRAITKIEGAWNMLEQIVREGAIETPTITEEYNTLLLGKHAV